MRRLTLLAAGLLLLAGCAQPNDVTMPGQTAVGDDGYTVTATFAQVENLVANSQVLYRDVQVGTVTAIDATPDWQASVTLRLLDDVDLPANATFAIGQKTLLGAQYVEVLDPDRPTGHLRDTDVVPVGRTGLYPDTEQVLGAAALLLNNGGLSQISTITRELGSALDQRVPDTRHLLTGLDELLGRLDDNRGQIIATLASLERLSGRLDRDGDVVARAIDRVTPALQVLDRQRRRLVRAVTAAGGASVDAVDLIDRGEGALLANLASVRPVLTRLSTVSSQLPEALNYLVSLPFPVTTTGQAVKGDYANLFATIDVSAAALTHTFGPGVLEDLATGDASAGEEPAPSEAPDAPLPDLPLLPDLSALPDLAGLPLTTDEPCSVVVRLLGAC